MEAVLLGYKVTRLYEVKEYEKRSPLFHSYVSTCWEGRQRAAKDSAQNLAFKFAMNSLTGKFGQRTHLTNSAIYSTDYEPSPKKMQAFKKMVSRVCNFTPIFGENGQNNAIILETENDNTSPSYPIYLSGQILAYARCIMSRIMRLIDAYRNEDFAIKYTDTDSLLMPSAALDVLIEHDIIGDGLGQIKCDLNKKFTHPRSFAKIVKGIWAATKGPYSLVYVLPDSNILWEKVRVKGIPHASESFQYHDPLRMHQTQSKLRLYPLFKRWLNDPQRWDLPCGVIGQRFYYFKSLVDKEKYFAAHINHHIIELLMKKEGELFAFYGGMKRCFENVRGDILLVKPDLVKRTACKTDWWLQGKRIFKPGCETVFDLSYPPGYVF
jgi:hypothetical protein